MREAISYNFFWNFQIFNNVWEIVVEGIYYLHIIRYNFLIFGKVTFSLDFPKFSIIRDILFVKVCKIFLFYFFEKWYTKVSLFCAGLYTVFATVGFFKNVFLKRVLSIVDLDNTLIMNGLLFPRMYFSFLEHDAQVHSDIIQKIIADF